ncbi:uncharacterized protein LOC110616191 [Manihot esculenta]|uniref:uncharacterized protein LOC110616191 n=1 Tax=Manihot esculenta TaxID=3983 RepID=UPI000B5D6021|nr:uncharacterized protein LOC110616191 [Manihot esculenta]
MAGVPEIKMGQLKIFKNWRLPLRSLSVVLEVLLVGRSTVETIRQVAGTISPRSSGRPPPLLVVRIPKRFWGVEGFALILPFFGRDKEISPMPLLSAFDINGSGENAQLIVPFGVKYQYYARLRSAAFSQASGDTFECMLSDLLGAVTRKPVFSWYIRTSSDIISCPYVS